VFDGDCDVGRGVSFQLTGRKSCSHVSTLDEAKAAIRAEYLAGKSRAGPVFALFRRQIALVGCHTAHVPALLSLATGQPRRGSFLSRRKKIDDR
jgi:hypothetical protein